MKDGVEGVKVIRVMRIRIQEAEEVWEGHRGKLLRARPKP